MADIRNTEALVIKWLNDTYGSEWPTYGEFPEQAPEKFMLCERVGGPREAMVLDKAEILIEVYHKKSKIAASDQANKIGDDITELLSLYSNVTHVDVNSTIPVDDTRNQYRRYHVYVRIWNRR